MTPRWVPTLADLDNLADLDGHTDTATARAEADRVDSGRHARRDNTLPDDPRAVWRLDASAVRGVISLGLAAVVGALAVVIWGWPRGTAVESPGAAEAVASHSNVLVDQSPSASPAALLVIDVDGEVRRPGVVELAPGSRVVDALKAAGGVTGAGDTGDLNLAELLIDGQQVVVPSTRDPVTSAPVAPSGGTAPGPTSAAMVSLNSASAVELETLPGIGPVLAAAIVEWRAQNGGFTSIEQLQDVSGIGPATFAELAPLVRL